MVGGLEALKHLLQQRKAEARELAGDKKYLRKSELEEARLKRLREEEEAERRAKEEKRRKLGSGGAAPDGRPATPTEAGAAAADDGGSTAAGADRAATPGAAPASPAPHAAAAAAQQQPPALPRDEVMRRLRALGQPVTLFGEEDSDRAARLAKVERSIALVDETRGGQQENVMLMLKRAEKAKAKAGGGGDKAAAAAAAAAAGAGSKPSGGGGGGAAPPGDAAAGSSGPAGAKGSGEGPPAPDGAAGGASGSAGAGGGAAAAAGTSDASDPDALLAAFEAAAARVAAQRAEEALPIEDRMARLIRGWCEEWEADLDARSDEVKMSGAGSQATMVYRQSMTYFEPLFERLKKRQLGEELKVGLWMMISHMRDRNYLAANDVYLKLAIGNAPWPIGVTQVGLHERSAREKISHSLNSSSQAHIMNDEATRKYFQAVKRLMTNLQRLHPTDPSRSVDFDVHGDAGRGAAGGGSNRVALLTAAAKGELPALPAAPHLMAPDGSVRIPPKWNNVLRREGQKQGIDTLGADADADDDGRGHQRSGRGRGRGRGRGH